MQAALRSQNRDSFVELALNSLLKTTQADERGRLSQASFYQSLTCLL